MKKTAKNCILTGGSGFLGLNLAQGLLRAGHSVAIADLKASSVPGFEDVAGKVNFFKVDYRDAGKMKKVLKGQEVLFHLACSSLPATSVNGIEDDIGENALEAVRLFRAASEAGVGLIVFPSSGGTVYGDAQKLPIDESSFTNPICPYGVTKLMIEKYLQFFNKVFGMDYLIFRIANLYGPGQIPNASQGLIANVIARSISGKPITIFGDGENVRDYIYVEDAVEAFIAGIERGLKNDLFNIASGKGYSINDLVRIISKTVKITPSFAHSAERPFDVRANILDSSKFASATGWKAKTGIEDGIKKTHDWVKNFSGKR